MCWATDIDDNYIKVSQNLKPNWRTSLQIKIAFKYNIIECACGWIAFSCSRVTTGLLSIYCKTEHFYMNFARLWIWIFQRWTCVLGRHIISLSFSVMLYVVYVSICLWHVNYENCKYFFRYYLTMFVCIHSLLIFVMLIVNKLCQLYSFLLCNW